MGHVGGCYSSRSRKVAVVCPGKLPRRGWFRDAIITTLVTTLLNGCRLRIQRRWEGTMPKPRTLSLEALEPRHMLTGQFSFDFGANSSLGSATLGGVGNTTFQADPIVTASNGEQPLPRIKSREHVLSTGYNEEIRLQSSVDGAEFRWRDSAIGDNNTFNGLVHSAKAHLEVQQTPVGVVANPQGGGRDCKNGLFFKLTVPISRWIDFL